MAGLLARKAGLCLGLVFALLAWSAPAVAEGSRSLYPNGYVGSRSTMDLRTTTSQRYMGVISARQFLYVYAKADEYILVGSSNRSAGEVRIYDPQSFGTKADETRPGTPSFTCNNSAASAGNYSGTGRGLIDTRAKELAGPNSADNSVTVVDGYSPCAYKAPRAGVYGVQFTGASTGGFGTPDGIIATPQLLTNQVSAWDVTVRANATSTTDLHGRLFTYAWVGYTGANPRPVNYTLNYVTRDGYRYRQTMRGIDPNAAAMYANSAGFLDTGAPLYKDVRGGSDTVSTTPFPAGVTPQQPEYPLFFSDVDPNGPNAAEVAETLGALGIPLVPPTPQLTNAEFKGNVTGNQATVSSGGLFQFETVNTQTYEIVISRDGSDFDPANVLNRVITGVALTGTHNVYWDGKDNSGNSFPIGDYDFKIAGRNGEAHFPMLDIEGNGAGGPTLTKLNGSGGTTVYYDDRGYVTRGGTAVGALNGNLCGATSPVQQPSPNHSLVGIDSNEEPSPGVYHRSWSGTNNDGGNCNGDGNTAFGNYKGLDLWALERTAEIRQPIVIVPAPIQVDVGTQLAVTGSAYPGGTVYGNLAYNNAGTIGNATAVGYTMVFSGSLPSAVVFTTLPTGVTFTYNNSTGVVAFTGLPTTLNPGDTRAFNFQYVAPSTGPVSIRATIDSTEDTLAGSPRPPTQPVPNEAIASTNVIVADAATTVTVPATAAPGSTVVGSVVFENLPSASATAESLIYTLVIGTPGSCPANVTFPNLPAGISATWNPVDCSVSFSGMPAMLDPGQSVTIDFTYTAPASGTVPVNAGIATGTPESNAGNNQDSGTTTIVPTADVSIAKTGPATVQAGAPISYTLTIANAGPSAANGASFTDNVPSGITGVTAVCGTVTGGAVCNAANITVAGNAVSGTIATLPSGASAQIVVSGTAPASATTLVNSAQVTPPAGTNDPDPDDNDSPPVSTVVEPRADMEATIELPSSANAGDPVQGTFTCTNHGPSPAENATCAVTGLPPGAVVACVPPPPVTSLPSGGTIACTVDFTAPASGPVTGTATAGSTTPDPVPTNNVATDPMTITPVAHLTIAKTGTASVVAGNNVSYTIVVGNTGPSDALGVMLDDPAPQTGIAFVSAGAPCASGFPCSLGTIAANGSVSVNVVFSVAANYSGPSPFTNIARAWSPTDPAHSNAGSALPGMATTTVVAPPDLAVAKSHTGNFHQGQVGASYTILVSNVGSGPTTGLVRVEETLPTGLTATTIVGTGWTCTLTPLACERSDVLASGASYPDIVLTVDVADDAVDLINVVDVSTPNDPTPGNNHDEDPTVIDPAADIGVLKSVDNATPFVGATINFTIVATNHGPSPATNVIISDGLPAGLAFVSATPTQGSYSAVSGNWTIPGPLAAGASATLSIEATVTASGSITNTATRTGGDQYDPNPSNNSSSVPVNGAPTADVQVSKIVNNATPNLGSNVVYTIGVHNAGPDDATNVMISDPLPAGLTYVSAAPSQGTYDPVSGVWTVGNLVFGDADATLSIVATVTTTTPILNVVTRTGHDQYDPNPANDEAGVPVNGQAADIQVVKVADNANATLGDPVTYTVTVTNNGPSPATGVSVTDLLPAGLAFVSATATQGTYAQSTGLWTIGNLDASGSGATVSLTIQATVTSLGTIINVATSNGGDQPDPNSGNNSDSVPINGTPLSPPTAQKAFAPASAPIGTSVQMTVTLSNAQALALSGVAVSDTYPAGLLNAATPLVSNTCGGTLTAVAATGSFSLVGGTIAANGSCAITLNVVGQTEGSLVNTTGPITSDNALPGTPATGTLVVTPVADVSIAKTGPATVQAGAPISYTLTIANAGPSAANGASFTDNVPSGITGVTAVCGTVTGGAVCNAANITVTGNAVSGTIATLPSGASAQIVVSGTAPASATTLVNSAQVTPPAGTNDPDPDDNDSPPVETVVGAAADLVLRKTGSATVMPGGDVGYTITVDNLGPSDAANVVLTDPTPAGLIFVSADAPCAAGFPCTLGTLASGASLSIGVVYSVPRDYVGANPIVNTASVGSDTPDPVPSNNVGTANTVVGTLAANLSLTKTAAAASVSVGDALVWTLVVHNAGPSDATGVMVTDTLPAGLTDVVTSGCAEDPAGTPDCTLGSIAAGASASYTISARVTAAAAADLVNTAVVGGNEVDPDPSDNSSDSEVVVIHVPDVADLSLVKRALGPAQAGATLDYEIVVRNAGPSTAVGVVVHDTLPSSLSPVSSSGCLNDPNGVPTCQLGDLPAGAQATYRITVRVAADASGVIVNTADATSSTPDPDGSNNESSSSVPVAAPIEARPVPTLSQWALLVLMLAMTMAAAGKVRRKL